nr:NADH dehydrogenase subunit 5 [Alcedoecus sp.]
MSGNYIWMPLLVSLVGLIFMFMPFLEIYLESVLFSSDLIVYKMSFFLDKTSIIFLFMVGAISSMVYFYSLEYMKFDLFKTKFMVLMMMFVTSMMMLSVSSDLFWCMLGWDGLGIVSFALIFFYSNWKSYNSAMVTFVSNRVGDICMIYSIIFLSMNSSSSWIGLSQFYTIWFFFLLGVFSKSAQVPFSAWLPLAMAAPTPVSSLVHSSTLVTAGIYMMIRFKAMLSDDVMWWMYSISSISILLAGVSSIGETDFKKIIALSTLSHISLIIMMISIKSFNSAMIHMVMHAFFKSLLFMIVGFIIHENLNSQDLRSISSSDKKINLSIVISISSMCGIPFLSGFYSKEIMSASLKDSHTWWVFYVAVLITSTYSVRMMKMFMGCGNIMTMTHVSSTKFFLLFCILCATIGLICNNFYGQDFMENFYSSKSNIMAMLFIFSGWGFGTFLVNNYYYLKNSKLVLMMSYVCMSFSIMVVWVYPILDSSKKIMYDLDLKGVTEKILFFNPILNSFQKGEFMNSLISFFPVVKFMSILVGLLLF